MLSIKSQKICPLLPAESATLSFALLEEAHFAVFSCQSKNPFTVQVLQNILTDVFNHALVFDANQAVLPVLEEALKDCKEAVLKLDAEAEFSAVAVLFKDDFVYVVMYGDTKALYLDGTQMVHVDTDREGQFASGAQKLDDGKVMVLCTHEFFKKYPPKSLISLDKPILAHDLDELSSAVILKVDRLDGEKVAGMSGEDKNKDKDGDRGRGKDKEEKNGQIDKVEKVVRNGGVAPSVGEFKPSKTSSGDGKTQSVAEALKKPSVQKFVKPVAYILGILALLVIGYLVFRFVIQSPQPSNGKNSSVNQSSNTNQPGDAEDSDSTGSQDQKPQDAQIQSELSKKLDEANKVQRVQPQVFYDISITDAKVSPTELAQGQKYLAVSDATQGKIYISAKDVTKFEELPQLFPGVKNLQFDGDTLVFTDNEGVKFYAITTKSVNKSYLNDKNYSALGPASEYLGFTYAVTDDKLVKFTKTGTALAGALWAQKEEFKTALSLDIDGSIYVLFSNGSLEKYTAGAKADFAIIGLDKPVQKPLKVVADADFKQIYMADGEEGRILAFDDDGVLDFQLKPELGSEWTALKSFDITPDEKTLYVLSGTKVFEFRL